MTREEVIEQIEKLKSNKEFIEKKLESSKDPLECCALDSKSRELLSEIRELENTLKAIDKGEDPDKPIVYHYRTQDPVIADSNKRKEKASSIKDYGPFTKLSL